MRNFIQAIFIIVAFAACNNKPSIPIKTDMVVLTPGHKMHVYTDAQSDTGNAETIAAPNPKKKNSESILNTPIRIPDNIANPPEQEIPSVVPAPVKEVEAVPATVATPETANTTNTGVNPPITRKQDTVISAARPVPEKKENKGWNNATKGAVIGGVGGAIGGAILSKKKGQGAIIGGIIGAAGGYIFGKTRDNKQAQDTTQFVQSN